jgi:hypothetical protein
VWDVGCGEQLLGEGTAPVEEEIMMLADAVMMQL